MTPMYRLFGMELSPYSIKVRSYLRYKGIPHEWIIRSTATQAEFDRHARLPLVPLLLAPDGSAMQDSTPIIEALEQRHPTPSIHPPDPALAFLSALLEEYGDEWGNKPMFHYRWWYPADQESAAERIASAMMPGLEADALANAAAAVRGRMTGRLSFVGSSAATKELIEASFRRALQLLEAHLATRPYLFGRRPAFADFGVYPQLYQCLTDPTPGALMRQTAPRVTAWVSRMLEPAAEGEFEAWDALAPTLEPLLREEVSGFFLPWSTANANALAAGEKTFRVTLQGAPFSQETQKYHARSLGALRTRFAAVADHARLDRILAGTGCLAWLT